MIGKGRSPRGEHRSSALWGTGNRAETPGRTRSGAAGRTRPRHCALCGARRRGSLAAGAQEKQAQPASTYIDPVLLAKAEATPNALVKVIIQSTGREATRTTRMTPSTASRTARAVAGEVLNRKFKFVGSVAVTLKARKVLQLAHVPNMTVTYDAPVKLSATTAAVTYSSKHVWPTAAGVKPMGQPAPDRRDDADDRHRRLGHREEPATTSTWAHE